MSACSERSESVATVERVLTRPKRFIVPTLVTDERAVDVGSRHAVGIVAAAVRDRLLDGLVGAELPAASRRPAVWQSAQPVSVSLKIFRPLFDSGFGVFGFFHERRERSTR